MARENRAWVRVLARAVNPVDVGGRSGALAEVMPGLALPAVPGRGSYAEVVSADPQWLAASEPAVDPAAGAIGAMNGSTALLALRNPRVGAGQTVLVTGAGGAVGGAAVQLAAHQGAAVVAVCSTVDEAYVSALAPRVEVVDAGRDTQRILAELKARNTTIDALLDTTGQAADLIATVRDGVRQPASYRGRWRASAGSRRV